MAKNLLGSDQLSTLEIPLVPEDLWALYLEDANERAKAKAALWEKSLGAFLLFAGLFAGVVSSFVISSASSFQPDPQVNVVTNISATVLHTSPNQTTSAVPATTVAINFLWFSSLAVTLISALAAVLAQTWLANFSFVPTKGLTGAMQRWMHDDKAQKWHLHEAITWITVMLQISLFLFLAGFALQAVVNNQSLGWLIASLVGLTLVMYLSVTVLPWIFPTTPFRTPFSDVGTPLETVDDSMETLNDSLQGSKSLAPTGGKPLSDHSSSQSITSRFKTFLSNARTLMKAPDNIHVKLGIYSYLLMMNSSKNTVIKAALMELMKVAKYKLTAQNCQSLIAFGLPATLCLRLTQLCQPQAEHQNPVLVQRMKIYLQAIMWMVDNHTADTSQLTEAFFPLVHLNGPLLQLNKLPKTCQAIAFGVRTHLFASDCKFGRIQLTDWYTMIENLELEFASTVFCAAARGLKLSKPPGVSNDCAYVLALYMDSNRLSMETGDLEQKSEELKKFMPLFFEQLEQAWKRSMCTCAVEALSENRFDRQLTGLEALEDMAQNADFQKTLDPILPKVVTALSSADWRTSVSCLQKLSKMYEQNTFQNQIRGILPKLVTLLSEPLEPVRNAALHLLELMKQEELAGAVKVSYFYNKIMDNLQSSDGTARIGSVRIFSELARTNKTPQIIQEVLPEILACLDFPDDALCLSVIQLLRVLSKQKIFHSKINEKMPQIIKIVSSHAQVIQDEIVDFLSALAKDDAFQSAINRNFLAIVNNNLLSHQWFTRQNSLRAFCKLVESGKYCAGIKNVFPKVGAMLSDADGNVRKTALQAVHAVVNSKLFSIMTNDVVVAVSKMFTDGEQTVRVSAFQTFSAIVKQHQIEFQDAIINIVPVVVSPLTSDWKTQVAVLETLSTLAEREMFADMVNDVIDQIITLLLSKPAIESVYVYVLKMLAALAPNTIFHDKLKKAIPIIALQLENKGDVRTNAIITLTTFATHDLFIGSSSTVVSQIVSVLAEGNTYTSDKVLRLLFTIDQAHQARSENVSEIAVFRYALVHQKERVRLAGLRGLHAHFKRNPNSEYITSTISDIPKYLQDASEYVQATALDIWFMLRYRTQHAWGTSQDQLDAVLNNVHGTISALLSSNTEAIYTLVIQMLSSFVVAGPAVRKTRVLAVIHEFQKEINSAARVIGKLLINGTNQRRIGILQTVSDLAKSDITKSEEFKNVVKHVATLLSEPTIDVRRAALQTFKVISMQEIFAPTVIHCLPMLIDAVGKDSVDGFEEIFHIEVLDVLSNLAKQDTYRDEINANLNKKVAIHPIEEREWSTRVAFLDLIFNLGQLETLKNLAEQMMPEIGSNLRDDENKSNRLAGVRLLSVPGVKETSYGKLADLVPTLVTLLSDPEEEIRIAVLHILSELAKQDTYRESIYRALPGLEDALRAGDEKTRVAALETWSTLAQEATFYERVNSAASNIAACLKDPEFNVRITALTAFSQFSKDEAFRNAVAEAAPNIISQLENPDWKTYVHVLRTLKNISENDAFSDILNSFVPKIVESLQNQDQDVQSEGVNLLLTLIQQDIYHRSIQSTLGPSALSMLVKLLLDCDYSPVKLGILQLLPRVIKLASDKTVSSINNAVKELICLLSKVDPYNGKDICIAALKALAEIAEQGVVADFKSAIQRINQLMKPDGIDNNVCTAALHTLSAFSRSNDCVDPIMAIVPTIISNLKVTDDECRKAGINVILGLAQGSKQKLLLPLLSLALKDSDMHVRALGLKIMHEFIRPDMLDFINGQFPVMLKLLDDREEEVRIAAIHTTVALCAVRPSGHEEITRFHDRIYTEWNNVMGKLKDPDQWTHITAWDNIPQLAQSLWLAEDRQVPNIESPIIAALRDSNPDVCLCALQTLLKLAENFSFRTALLHVIPVVLANLSDRRGEIRRESLSALLCLTEYKEFRPRIGQGLHRIISASTDRVPEVRAISLKVLLKFAQDKISENIKQTAPHLLTLLQHQSTRRDAVALITCLATDKTTRAALLSTLRLVLQGKAQMVLWGHLLLIENLFKQGKIGIEEAFDLHFALSFITSKQLSVKDFILKFMTTTLQQYLAHIRASPIQLSVKDLMEGKGGRAKVTSKQ